MRFYFSLLIRLEHCSEVLLPEILLRFINKLQSNVWIFNLHFYYRLIRIKMRKFPPMVHWLTWRMVMQNRYLLFFFLFFIYVVVYFILSSNAALTKDSKILLQVQAANSKFLEFFIRYLWDYFWNVWSWSLLLLFVTAFFCLINM